MNIGKRSVWTIVAILLAVQAAQLLYVVHRESLTFDEDDHMFAGYMMIHAGDYGLNPEHPPLVKLLAALPLIGRDLFVPPLQGRNFKKEAYLDGRDWLARNDGASQRLVFRMRLAAGLLALAFSLVVFFAASEWFGVEAGLTALAVFTFDPNILAHSALVTTDIGVSLFFLASIFAFYRYIKNPSLLRLLITGVTAGLLLASKHSGILLAPMLVLLIGWEIAFAPKDRRRLSLRLAGAFAAIVVVGVVVLWAFYGFRYAARPAGSALNPPLASFVERLSPFDKAAILTTARFHLLPESYLMGLVDVKHMAEFYPTYLLGKVYAHGQWIYFPVVILIKSTLGLLAMLALAIFAISTGHLRGKSRELTYLLLPGAVYLAVAMLAGMDIGARHILPLCSIAAILAAAALAALAARNRRWLWVGAVLVFAHIASSASVFPNYMAYANEAWGGPKNLHNLLSDANVDWGQQLIQVKQWQDRHPDQECWFAYFARPEIDPAVYGIRCHAMPTVDTQWLGGSDLVPPNISGYVLISAGDLSGCEWASSQFNPYVEFQPLKPDELIDYGVLVYRGNFRVNQAAALSRAQNADALFREHKADEALAMAREAVAFDPADLHAQSTLGNIAAKLGLKDEARAAWQAALASAMQLEPEAQPGYVPDLEAKLKAL